MKLDVEFIRKRMKKLGFTPYSLSKAMGMTYESIRYILRKRSTKLSTIEKLAKVLESKEKELVI